MKPVQLPTLKSGKKLRNGQCKALSAVEKTKHLNVKLPTGYGKTLLLICTYWMLKVAGRANRLLVIFPTEQQLINFVKDAPSDLRDVGIEGPLSVVDLRFYGKNAISKNINNEAQVFVVTVQSLIQNGMRELVKKLMKEGKWHVTVDEYHHYGLAKKWGEAVLDLDRSFLLPMSATPHRPNDDEAFGKPNISIRYREAVREGAVKPLRGHAYHYFIDAITPDGDVKTYTTRQLIDEVGGNSPDEIELFTIERKMRWSPKYVSPLIQYPIDRMLRERLYVPGGFLQVLVKAMCISHAKLVYTQVASMYPDLRVDWVGTGENGRDPELNKKILGMFCPPKGDDGKRRPSLDVLVHVGMAGEGLDSIHVSEVTFLDSPSKNNTNDQGAGRAARFIKGINGNINFDATSEYNKRGYLGIEFEKAMDDENPDPRPPDNPGGDDLEDLPEMPDEPEIEILDIEFDGIDSGNIEVIRYKEAAKRVAEKEMSPTDHNSFVRRLKDLNDPIQKDMLEAFKNQKRQENEQINEQSIIVQWKEAVGNALRTAAGMTIRVLYDNKRVEKSIAGDIKKRINQKKKLHCGELTEDLDVCKKHYKWLKKLDQQIRDGDIPEWLQ